MYKYVIQSPKLKILTTPLLFTLGLPQTGVCFDNLK